jgi:hypothetical protein
MNCRGESLSSADGDFVVVLEPRRMVDKAPDGRDSGSLHPGVSTRSVDDSVKAMGISGISKSQVSRQTHRIQS